MNEKTPLSPEEREARRPPHPVVLMNALHGNVSEQRVSETELALEEAAAARQALVEKITERMMRVGCEREGCARCCAHVALEIAELNTWDDSTRQARVPVLPPEWEGK